MVAPRGLVPAGGRRRYPLITQRYDYALNALPPNTAAPGQRLLTRVDSIDVLRALTMVLMIFVNDLWSLTAVPVWLEHVPGGVDGIGLADVVFPAFLFIVGLSAPFAIGHRRSRGDSDWQIVVHVLSRTLALLVMGLWLVNGESINEGVTGLKRVVWNVLCCSSFVLIWNSYPKTMARPLLMGLKTVGWLVLLTLAIVYRGGETMDRFQPHWWGIPGLIAGRIWSGPGLRMRPDTTLSCVNYRLISSGQRYPAIEYV